MEVNEFKDKSKPRFRLLSEGELEYNEYSLEEEKKAFFSNMIYAYRYNNFLRKEFSPNKLVPNKRVPQTILLCSLWSGHITYERTRDSINEHVESKMFYDIFSRTYRYTALMLDGSIESRESCRQDTMNMLTFISYMVPLMYSTLLGGVITAKVYTLDERYSNFIKSLFSILKIRRISIPSTYLVQFVELVKESLKVLTGEEYTEEKRVHSISVLLEEYCMEYTYIEKDILAYLYKDIKTKLPRDTTSARVAITFTKDLAKLREFR